MQKLRKYQHLQQKINQKELEFNSGSFLQEFGMSRYFLFYSYFLYNTL
ncbi:hypothetical protein SaSA16_0249 [Streptococcus agalactiae]|nr:hypothetical protein SaSA53_0248 [Streptococcus agalactiae]AUO91310.1 hypothetical protein SaSA16_0249 [Streptococcus agalactiae]AUO96316.1 hypothetical protein SaSA81_0249 [Streptococcus agalactiae]AUP25770.1 hypothetical protein SaSA289_0248 [Streptococcus agalactiae]AUP27478.1 hypothetical protein SaSA330_0251 [Streptococcus agalactiae]